MSVGKDLLANMRTLVRKYYDARTTDRIFGCYSDLPPIQLVHPPSPRRAAPT